MGKFSILLEEYNKVELASKIRNVIILSGAIKPNQEELNSSITMLYNGIKNLGIKTYMFNPDKIQFVNSNNTYSITTSDKNIRISPNDSVIFYRRTKPESQVGMSLLKELESLGFICINSFQAIENCNNKYLTYTLLKKLSISTPETLLINKSMSADDILTNVNKMFHKKYPLIVKILDGSKGIGVSIVESERSLISVVQSLLANNDNGVIIQEFLKNDGDYRVHVVNGKVVAVMKREPNKDDSDKEFRANISLGGTAKGMNDLDNIDPELLKLAIAAHNCTGAIWSGVDIMKESTTGKYYVIEVNASPGLQGISKVVHTDIIKAIFDELKFTHLSEVTGVFDRITIEGLGEFSCILDTGNMKHSMSLNAKIISIDDKENTVKYKIANGNIITDKIEKYTRVKSNASSTEDSDRRVIVKHNVVFRNKVYKDILIDLNDRSHKKYQVLVNYDFIKLAKIIIKPE